MAPPQDPPPIIDIESSGFGPEGYPIEIGLALSSGQTFCSLIQPEPAWQYWDEKAEEIHRIPRDILEVHGRPVDEVAAELNELLAGQTAFSDDWAVDQPRLQQLFGAAKTAMAFDLNALDGILSDDQMRCWQQTKDQVIDELDHKRHRASLDAVVIQKTYMLTKELDAPTETIA